MAVQLDAELDDEELKRYLRNVLQSVRYPFKNKKIVETINVLVFKDIINHFATEKGPNGPWQEWSLGYRKYREKIGKGGGKILALTGRMRNATVLGSRGQDYLKWINKTPYAAKHDLGLEGMPQRQFMWLSPQITEEIAVALLNMIESGEIDG